MKVFASTFAALALLAASSQAAPLDVKNVAADAKWVVHVDVDAIRDSTVVQKAFETCPVLKSDSGQHFDMIRDKFGIDLRKDLHGITLYGLDTDKQHAVAIVFTEVDKKPLLEKAGKAADHKVTKHGEIDIHSWTDKHGDKTHPAAGAFYKDDIMVFAATAEGVGGAIDVLDGKSPGITNARSPLAGRTPAGTTFLARAIAMPDTPQCDAMKQVVSFRIATGENNGKSFYRGSAVMKSPEAAAQVKAIVDGAKAMGTLRFSDKAEVMKLVDGLNTTVNNSTIRVRWDASADDVWTVVEKVGEKAAEHIKKMKEAKGRKTTSTTSECPFLQGIHTSAQSAGAECPVCKAAAEFQKATSAGETKCAAGCQCPACKAKAAKASTTTN